MRIERPVSADVALLTFEPFEAKVEILAAGRPGATPACHVGWTAVIGAS